MAQWTVQLEKGSKVDEKHEDKGLKQASQQWVETRGENVLGKVGSKFRASWRDDLGSDLPSQGG